MPITDIEKRREYARKWVAGRRKKWFDANGPCIDCGSNDNLELDHVDPALKVSHRIFSWSWKRIEEETAKCVVRYCSCHLKRTKVQVSLMLSKPIVHGTNTGYKNKGCRCTKCSSARKIYRRKMYLKNGN